MRATRSSSRDTAPQQQHDSLWRILRPDPDRQGFAVQIDWPGAGSVVHDFVQFTTDQVRALRRTAATVRFWRRGPLRPIAVTVASMTYSTFAAHRQRCDSLACPTVAPLLGMAGGGQACVQLG